MGSKYKHVFSVWNEAFSYREHCFVFRHIWTLMTGTPVG